MPASLVFAAETPTQCPQCHSQLVTVRDETPWCARCQWNLASFQPDVRLGWLSRRLDVLARRIGFRLDTQLHRSLIGGGVSRPRWSASRGALLAIATLLWTALVAAIGFAGWLIVTGSLVQKFLGGMLLLVVYFLRPRLGSVRDIRRQFDEIHREDAPHLFAVIGKVAQAIGAPTPDLVVLSHDFNASAGVVGLRRQRVLELGVALLAALTPQERIMLLGHELGHFVNGDPGRLLFAQPATTAFGRLASLLDPAQVFNSQIAEAEGDGVPPTWMAQWLFAPVLGVLSGTCTLIHLGLSRLSAADHQRAEYYADARVAEAAGTSAALTLQDLLLSAEPACTVIGSRARARLGIASWRDAVTQMRVDGSERLPLLRQLSIRNDASLFASHPPAGLRHAMLAASPYQTAQVVLTDTESALIDAEIAKYEERYRRIIAESW